MTRGRRRRQALSSRLAAICALATSFAACEQSPPETPEVVRPVRVVTVAGVAGGGTLEYPGEIQGVQRADLAFEVPGRIVEFPAREGITVAEGELLARLDATDYRASLDAAEARFRSSSETFERFSEIFERGAISQQELDTRQRQFEVERAQLDSARKAFADTSLTAPFSGRVGRTYVDNFTNVQAKQPVLSLQDLSVLEIVVNIPEQDWLRARPGLTLAQQSERVRPTVSLSSAPERTFPAVVTEVSAAADPVTRTFEARARFDPPEDLQILPGMSASVSVTIPADVEPDAVATYLPASAVMGANDGTPLVWIVDPSTMTVAARSVTVGELSGSDIEILAGLDVGDRVAVSGVQHLRDGMRIRELED